MERVKVSEIRKVAVEYRTDVDIWEVQKQADNLYRKIKLLGLKNISTYYKDENGIEVEKPGQNTSRRTLELAAFLVMNMKQMSDSANSIERMEKHYGGVSIMSSVGYRLGLEKVSLVPYSNLEVVERYLDGLKVENHYDEVMTQCLYNLVVRKVDSVELWSLWTECEKLYKSIMTVGVENTNIWFWDENGERKSLHGSEIPERMRAFALFVVNHMYRFNDSDAHLISLGEKFGLSAQIRIVLGDTDIFRDSGDNMECISLSEIAGRYLMKESAGEMSNSPILFQVPYDLLILKKNKFDSKSILNLWTALDGFYKMAKIVGVKNVKIRYNEEGRERVVTGNQVPGRIRAFCGESEIYMRRMNDSETSRSRLETHLGLSLPSKYLLGDTNIVNCSSSLPCIPLREMLKRYLKS